MSMNSEYHNQLRGLQQQMMSGGISGSIGNPLVGYFNQQQYQNAYQSQWNWTTGQYPTNAPVIEVRKKTFREEMQDEVNLWLKEVV